jgi:hypothetical protein
MGQINPNHRGFYGPNTSLWVSLITMLGYPKNIGGMSGRKAGATIQMTLTGRQKLRWEGPSQNGTQQTLVWNASKIHSNAIGIEGFTWNRIWNRHKYKMKNTIPAVSPWSHRHFDDLMVNRNPHGISRWARPVWNTSRHYIREYKCKYTFK